MKKKEKVFGLHIIKVCAYIYHHTPLLCRGVSHTPEGISGAETCRGKVRLPDNIRVYAFGRADLAPIWIVGFPFIALR